MAYPFPLLMLWIAMVVSVSTFPATSTSRNSLGGFARKGFRATLRRVDSGGNLTGLERLSRAASRGAHRLSVAGTEVESRVRAGSGEFLVEMSIGTPPAPFEAIVDTGSDLIWTQCKPCRLCFPQRTPVFDPEKSSSFSRLPCSSNLCSALPVSSCAGGCEYTYSYGDYSTTQGVMATEVFTFDGNVTAGKVAFGCSRDNEGSGFSQGSGLVGLGRGPLSLVSQLEEPKFSYCLTAIDGGGSTSTLLMGAIAGGEEDKIGNSKKVTTPLVRNPSQPSFYYITLEGISLGRTRLPVAETAFKLNSDGSGGTIVDSGTTLTYLNGEAFGALKEELKRQMGHLAADESGATGLDLCFRLPPDAEEIAVPKLTLHLGGGADLELPGENYVVADKSYGVACLAMGSSSGGGGGGEGGMSIIGNIQQQNMMVIHDLVKDSISFVPTNCDHI
ncbi:hypothetical protein DM860_008387 [Cuscuta australis]|uniref:nepenthesin n=1 Tax=Cuscuta australis TaxID=267555 RepID=A0A328D365_9ASTE|nr:hypothetical protein DM860_008387 [Cuscuta australis]